MLKVSYCGRPLSGIRRQRRASVNYFFKHLLLPIHKANLDETWQGCSLGKALQKLFKDFNSFQNSGCDGNLTKINAKSLKTIFPETRRRRALKFGV